MAVDIIGREIAVDDFVVYYSNIYQVREVYPKNGYVKIKIWNGGTTSRPVKKFAKETAVLPKNDVLIWLMKQNTA